MLMVCLDGKLYVCAYSGCTSPPKGAEMKYTTIALTGCLAVMGGAMAQEKKVKPSDLPAAVEKTVAAQSQGATIR